MAIIILRRPASAHLLFPSNLRTDIPSRRLHLFVYLFLVPGIYFENDTNACLLLVLSSNIQNGKEHISWPFAWGYKWLCDISSLQRSVLWSVSSALSWLYQIVSFKVQYLAHKLPKVPKAKWADVSNCLGGRVCVRAGEIGKHKKEGMARELKEEVKPIW